MCYGTLIYFACTDSSYTTKSVPFLILYSKYNGDKWDNFYEDIPIALLDHTNGNGIYNTSHPLLERLVGQRK